MNNSMLRQKTIPIDVKLKNLVQKIKFSCVGTVSSVNSDGTRIDVTLPYLDCNMRPIKLKGIEVLRPGTHNIIIKYKPKIGDVALVISTQNCWLEAKYNRTPEQLSTLFEPYSIPTMKAILVQTNEDNSDATTIEVTDKELKVTTPLKFTAVVKDTANITLEKASTITCKADVTVDASSHEVVVKSSKTVVNNHLEIT